MSQIPGANSKKVQLCEMNAGVLDLCARNVRCESSSTRRFHQFMSLLYSLGLSKTW